MLIELQELTEKDELFQPYLLPRDYTFIGPVDEGNGAETREK